MPAVPAQIEKTLPKRCSLRETVAPRKSAVPYTEAEIELFALRLAIALSRPGAFDAYSNRIDALLKKTRPRG